MTTLLINKEEALVLAKILHQHADEAHSLLSGTAQTDFRATLTDLLDRVNDFLTSDDEDEEEEEDEDEEAADDGGEEEEPDEEDDSSDDEDEGEEDESEEGDGEDADSDEEEGDDGELEADSEVSGDTLHRLTVATTAKGAVEFEVVDETDSVDVLVDGFREVTDVTHVKRGGKLLEVLDADGTWTSFHVTRFPKGWAKALPLEELVEVFVE